TGQLLEEGHVEKLWKLQNRGHRTFFQDIKEADGKDWEHLSAVGKCESVTLPTHYMNLSENWAVNLCRMGAQESGVFDKHTLGGSDNWS
ncbi:hypothetical protein E2I00_014730, partial [Balaenoptera physalus]